MKKVTMNEQQFERFITENAIRVAQRYLMETIEGGADIDIEEGYGDFDEEDFDVPSEEEEELDYGPEDYDDPDYQIPRF